MLRLALVVVFAITGCTADLRPSALDDGLPADRQAAGRAWLDKALVAHGGLARFRALRDASVVLTDTWPGWLMRSTVMPWPESGQRLRVDFLLGQDDGHLTHLGGEADGLRWGVQDWATWAQQGDGPRDWDADDEIEFWVPTVSYFLELPFRIGEADVVAYTGDRVIGGRSYAVVFCSWGTAEPQANVDQYLVFVDRQTHRIGYAAYTVRDMYRFVKGAVHYQAWARHQGILWPTRMVMADEPGGDDVLHEMVVESVELDTGKPERWFKPEPGRRGTKG